MAICNARYQFTIVDMGDSRRQSDGGVYANSNLGYTIENKQVKLPGEKNYEILKESYHMYLQVMTRLGSNHIWWNLIHLKIFQLINVFLITDIHVLTE